MAIYAISDLHLSFGIKEKPMDIFSDKWSNYLEKIKGNWTSAITDSDTVLMAGDFSWATYLEDCLPDFKFLDELPGNKVIIRGNHDYWWTTLKKMNEFVAQNGIKSIRFLHNDSIIVEKYVVAGIRYWNNEEEYDNEKIFKRECIRAEIAMKDAQKLGEGLPIIFMTHYPPDERIIKCVEGYNVKKWIYGHIHSNYDDSIVKIDGIDTYLTSCDYLNFNPIKIA